MMRVPLLWIVSLLGILSNCLAIRAQAPSQERLVEAASRAIAIVEKSSAEYLKQRECFSCHHQAMSILALMKAREHGLKFDMQNLSRQVARTIEHLQRGQADYRQAKGQGGGVDTAGYALTALSAAQVPPSEITDAVVHYLLEIHSAKKHWSCSSNRPPTESSDLSTTAVAARGLATYFHDQSLPRLTQRIEDCDTWLAKQKPNDTEERVFRLFAAKTRKDFDRWIEPNTARVENDRVTIVELQQKLLSTQNADGGWSQLPDQPTSKSDAYATATTLNALISSGLSATNESYQRGLQYLLDTQESDGSWHVATRSKPIQKYFESGFPHGVDQFLSMQATCWAIMAIAQPLPIVAADKQPSLPWQAPAGPLEVANVEATQPEPSAEQLDFFEREIRPLLVENCISCHGPDDQSGELRVDSLASLLKGGESGPALIPRAVERSLMIKAVRRQDELKMPPDAPLSSVNVSRLERWIDMGAPWPKNLKPQDIDKRRAAIESHWAFQQPKPYLPPDVKKPEWAHNSIDRFVLANLEKQGLGNNRPASRHDLLRRLYFDLIGLPPSSEDFEQFAADDTPDAVERVIDRLLASPKFGQHWARHWLDVARYSDTKGYVYAREERFFVQAPLYRDWVVRALADDMPYDQFIKLQVAADGLAPDDSDAQAAMGFLTIGRRFLGVTHDIIDDRIDVVSRGLLGLTVGCARCHDHKFDPIPTADYYSLYGVFQNSIERRVRLADARDPAVLKPFDDEYIKRQQKYQEQLSAEKRIVNERILSRLADYLKAQLELDKYPAEGFDVLIQKDDLAPAQVRRIQAYLIDAALRQDNVFVAWRQFQQLPADTFAEQAVRVSKELQKLPPDQINSLVARMFREPPASMQQVAERYGQLLGRLELVVCDNQRQRDALQDLKQLVQADNSPFRMPDEDIVSTEQFFETRVCEALWKLQGEVDRWILQSPTAPAFATVLVDRSAIREPHIFRRGNPRQIGEHVPRQFLSALAQPDRPASAESSSARMVLKPFEKGSGRAELAEAIADPHNPLTTRVWTNRLWQHLFGKGLVGTSSDFGLRAVPPTHPELLDWLAIDLMRRDYSTKAIVRQIVSSSSYQQSSKCEDSNSSALFAKASELDPDNHWLWRGTARRLTFEQQRDAWLVAAGQLDYSFGGRAKQLFGEGLNHRRTLYGLVDRQFLSGVLRSFDFANPDLHIPQRSETTVPQQALFELNHEFTASVARSLSALVERLTSRDLADDVKTREKIVLLFRAVLGRQPTQQELSDATVFLQQPADLIPKPRDEVRDWRYGFGKYNSETNTVDGFRELPHFTGTAWQGGPKWPDDKLGWVQLTATGGHAGNDLDHAAVRRWIAPMDGTVSISSKVMHNVPAGDGVRAIVVHTSKSSGNRTLRNEVVHNSAIEIVDSMQVAAGDMLDFVVTFNANLNNDQFLWSPELKMQEKSWQAERDFAGKQPLYLDAWQQLAQVLLLSNELVFVD